MAILEACVETVDEARAVEQGGASRIELCANLAEQGTTPDEATIAARLKDRFADQGDAIEREVSAFLAELRQRGLVEG